MPQRSGLVSVAMGIGVVSICSRHSAFHSTASLTITEATEFNSVSPSSKSLSSTPFHLPSLQGTSQHASQPKMTMPKLHPLDSTAFVTKPVVPRIQPLSAAGLEMQKRLPTTQEQAKARQEER
eukprot:557458-Rhodomonas_salina.1